MAPFKKDDNWYTDVRYRYQGRSGRLRKKIGTRKKDADAAEAKIRTDIAAGTFVPAEVRAQQEMFDLTPLLFSDFVVSEFLPWSATEHSPRHHERVAHMLSLHMIPYMNGLHLHEITVKRIEDYKKARRRSRARGNKWKRSKAVKPATVNRELFCLKIVFRKAVDWGRLTHSPAADVKPFKELPAPPRLLEKHEVAALMEEVPPHLFAMVATLVYAGLRQAELFYQRQRKKTRKWADFRRVVKFLAHIGHQRHFGPRKNAYNSTDVIVVGACLSMTCSWRARWESNPRPTD